MSTSADPIDIIHDTDAGRFHATVAGMTSVCDYRVRDGIMAIVHTEVAPPLEGRGIAAQLTRAALDWARHNGLAVLPLCSYARTYIARHPEYQTLVKH